MRAPRSRSLSRNPSSDFKPSAIHVKALGYKLTTTSVTGCEGCMRSPGKTRFRSLSLAEYASEAGSVTELSHRQQLVQQPRKEMSGSRSRSIGNRSGPIAAPPVDRPNWPGITSTWASTRRPIERSTKPSVHRSRHRGEPRSALDQRPLAEALYVRGRLWNEYGKLERAYATLLDSIRLTRHSEHPDAAMTGDCGYVLGIVCGRLGRDMEAAYWLWSAVESEHRDASLKLGERFLDTHAEVAAAVPKPVLQLLVGLGGANRTSARPSLKDLPTRSLSCGRPRRSESGSSGPLRSGSWPTSIISRPKATAPRSRPAISASDSERIRPARPARAA